MQAAGLPRCMLAGTPYPAFLLLLSTASFLGHYQGSTNAMRLCCRSSFFSQGKYGHHVCQGPAKQGRQLQQGCKAQQVGATVLLKCKQQGGDMAAFFGAHGHM